MKYFVDLQTSVKQGCIQVFDELEGVQSGSWVDKGNVAFATIGNDEIMTVTINTITHYPEVLHTLYTSDISPMVILGSGEFTNHLTPNVGNDFLTTLHFSTLKGWGVLSHMSFKHGVELTMVNETVKIHEDNPIEVLTSYHDFDKHIDIIETNLFIDTDEVKVVKLIFSTSDNDCDGEWDYGLLIASNDNKNDPSGVYLNFPTLDGYEVGSIQFKGRVGLLTFIKIIPDDTTIEVLTSYHGFDKHIDIIETSLFVDMEEVKVVKLIFSTSDNEYGGEWDYGLLIASNDNKNDHSGVYLNFPTLDGYKIRSSLLEGCVGLLTFIKIIPDDTTIEGDTVAKGIV